LDILPDLLVLFISVGATYLLARVWHYATSRPAAPQVDVRDRTQTLNKAIDAINEHDDIRVKLSQVQRAIEAAKNLNESELPYKLPQLEEMRVALHNDAMRFKLNKMLDSLRKTVDNKDKLALGQEMLTFLDDESKNQAADPRLIVHYKAVMEEHVEQLERAAMPTEELEDESYHNYVSEFLDTHTSLLDFSLDNDIPEGVRFFDRTEIAASATCGQDELSVVFEIEGHTVDPDELDNAFGKALLQTIYQSISRRVGPTRCPRHGTAPGIVVRGNSLSELSWQTPSCCQQLRDAVGAKLHNH